MKNIEWRVETEFKGIIGPIVYYNEDLYATVLDIMEIIEERLQKDELTMTTEILGALDAAIRRIYSRSNFDATHIYSEVNLTLDNAPYFEGLGGDFSYPFEGVAEELAKLYEEKRKRELIEGNFPAEITATVDPIILGLALRYSLGRFSYAPETVRKEIMKNIDVLSDSLLERMYRDINSTDALIEGYDKDAWMSFAREIELELEGRYQISGVDEK